MRSFSMLCLLAICTGASANTITVDTLADNGVAGDGLCTLREAINNANAGGGGDCAAGDDNTGVDTIIFAVAGTIAPASKLPTLTQPVLINGVGTAGNPTAPCPAWPPAPSVRISGGATATTGLAIAGSGGSTVRGLVIANFGSMGVDIGTSSAPNRVQCSFIGTDVSGMVAAGNATDVSITNSSSNIIGTDGDGVNDANEGNLISGASGSGIAVSGSGSTQNRIAGNRIGTNVTQSDVIPIGFAGVQFASGPQDNIVGTNADGISDPAEANVIGGCGGGGVLLSGTTTALESVQGNFIGRSADGSTALPNTAGVVVQAGSQSHRIARNVIASNAGPGVRLNGAGTFMRIDGNRIGTDATGAALGNTGAGVEIESTTGVTVGTDGDGMGDAGELNVIASNGGCGVEVNGSANVTIAGNAIGTSAAATTGNTLCGVWISNSVSSFVGRVNLPSEGNLIAGNGGAGVIIESGKPTRVRSNAIVANGGLGIDLGGDGVTDNDPGDTDDGPNGVQNAPVITNVAAVGAMLEVTGTFGSTPVRNFTLEVFKNGDCDASGFGEGEALLGSVAVMTNANGDAPFVFDVAATPEELANPPGITATATGNEGTSEFSNCFRRDALFADGFE